MIFFNEKLRTFVKSNPFYIFGYVVIAWALLHFNIFGVSELTDRYSQDLFNIGFGEWIYEPIGQEQVSVLLVHDSTLKHQEEHWPVPYRFHARVLNSLRAYKPKAIMVDILFFDHGPDPTLKEFLRVLKRLKRNGIPLYLAVRHADDIELISPEFQAELKELVIPVAVPGLFDKSDFVTRQYPMSISTQEGDLETAAFKMYHDNRVKEEKSFDTDDFRDQIEVFWGVTQDRVNAKWMKPCTESWFSRIWHIFSGGTEEIDQDCLYTRTLFVDDLLTRSSDPDLPRIFEGRFVFYGTLLVGMGDIVHTALHTTLPGVYYHAMALDNLLTWEENYLRRSLSDTTNDFIVLATEIIFLLLLAILSLGCSKGKINVWLVFVLSSLAAICLGIINFFWFNLAVANWVGYLSFISIDLFLLKKWFSTYKQKQNLLLIQKLWLK